MKILFLHGWQSTPGGLKPTFLKDHGHEVLNPGRADETVPFADSEELFRNSGLPSSARIVVGTEHRLADPQSLAVMLEACERRLKSKQGKPTSQERWQQFPVKQKSG